ncbi:hypothetical protein [Vibrio quintilis]|uniref:Uncharacterized protein n=1 Tax=Vibrio quintilis TaxID=1117707 RepID=A0A1M7YQZ7_9VIBR|nr:hypothetical protein [Vibrio quintilis]SHO54995.1 hypothetical protein VQ7734_00714 [Vibrio quintilis]
MKKFVLLLIFLSCKASAFSETALDFSHFSVMNDNTSDTGGYHYQSDFVNEVVLKKERPVSGPVNYWGWGSGGTLEGIAAMEIMAAGFSYWGATNPTGFGWFTLSGGVGALTALPEGILWSASLFALSDYNFKMADRDDLDEEDIFIRNFVAIHAIYATFYATTILFPAFDGDLALYPDTKGNWYLNYSYSF